MDEKRIEKEVYDFLRGVNETEKIYFVGSTTENAVEYKIGDEIVFKIRVKCAEKFIDVPQIKYTLDGDDGQKENGFISPADDGWFYIKTSLKRDGFVHLIAEAFDENGVKIPRIDKFEGGAGANVRDITLSTEIPEDYLEFWDWLKKETESVEPEVIYDRVIDDEKYPDYEIHDMRIRVVGDEYASCMVSFPKGARKGSLKLKSYYRGYGVDPITEPYCFPDCLTTITNAHPIPNDQTPEWYQNERATTYKSFGFVEEENDDPKTTYWAKMFRRDLQSFRFFKNHPLVNGRDYLFEGGSMGAMQSCSIAAHCGCATKLFLFVPWMSDLGAGVLSNRLVGWRPAYRHGIKYFDTAVAARFVKCPVTMSVGLGDYICPPSGQMALYNGITTEKSIEFRQNKTHGYNPPEEVQYHIKG